jgi:hypothetical protein
MSESYRVGAYWGSRPESAEQCAQRAEMFFRLLAQCHPSYTRWFEKTRSAQKTPPSRFEPTREVFTRFFGQKKYQSGNDGFHFGAWTGHEEQDQGGMLMLRCGSKAEVAPNYLLLFFPNEALGSEHMLKAPVLASVMRAMALAWEPEWAIATAEGLWEQFSNGGCLGTFVGWMTYFSRQRGQVPALPAPARVEAIGDKGSLVSLTPERLTPSQPDHVVLVQRVQQLLEQEGLLGRVIEPHLLHGT